MATRKKAPAKKAAKKPARSTAKASARPAKAIKSRFSKTDLLNHITGATDVSRKQANAVLDELSSVIAGHLAKNGCGEFVLPGLFKAVTVKKPARKARKGINPFTKEEVMFKAKPASVQVKIRPLKKMKDMVG